MRSEFATLVCVAALAASARAATAEPTAASVTGVLPRSADWGLAHPSGRDTRFWVIAPPYDGLLRTATEVHLYDPTEKQFFRDAPFFDKKTPAGKKTFGSRGDGWGYGGLALMLEHLPADPPTRGFYEKLFRAKTTAILAAQPPDGLWRPSLRDPTQVPLGETSGIGFFVFGLAWGVNHGLLARAKHWPAIPRGWAGLVTRTKPDGFVGYVQAIGAAPAPLTSESVQDSCSIPSRSSARARPTSVSHSAIAPSLVGSAKPVSPFN